MCSEFQNLDENSWDNWIGNEVITESELDPAQAQKLEVTINRKPSLQSGDVLPCGWHWLYFHDLTKTDDLGRDGHPKLGLSLPKFPMPRRMWAGGNIKWHKALQIGVPAERKSKILKIEHKNGRSGSLIFVTYEHLISQNNELAITEEQNIVYREEVKQVNVTEPELARTDSDFYQTWQLNEAALFRYSALTFNSHRIHYDVAYVREVEGYSGLIVHGPLLATLILDLAVSNNRPINQFSYRAKNPITLPQSFSTHGKANSTGTSLWVASFNDSLAMQAELV